MGVWVRFFIAICVVLCLSAAARAEGWRERVRNFVSQARAEVSHLFSGGRAPHLGILGNMEREIEAQSEQGYAQQLFLLNMIPSQEERDQFAISMYRESGARLEYFIQRKAKPESVSGYIEVLRAKEDFLFFGWYLNKRIGELEAGDRAEDGVSAVSKMKEALEDYVLGSSSVILSRRAREISEGCESVF